VSVVKFAYFYRTELFNNIQRGVLKLPVSMSLEAKNLIVHLLNRNPSRRLGAGPEGADEIKRHQFFADIDWNEVAQRRLIVPKPKASV
jgi:serine/threonine protein kinase